MQIVASHLKENEPYVVTLMRAIHNHFFTIDQSQASHYHQKIFLHLPNYFKYLSSGLDLCYCNSLGINQNNNLKPRPLQSPHQIHTWSAQVQPFSGQEQIYKNLHKKYKDKFIIAVDVNYSTKNLIFWKIPFILAGQIWARHPTIHLHDERFAQQKSYSTTFNSYIWHYEDFVTMFKQYSTFIGSKTKYIKNNKYSSLFFLNGYKPPEQLAQLRKYFHGNSYSRQAQYETHLTVELLSNRLEKLEATLSKQVSV